MEFQIIRNDVSIMAVDAIVLPANKQLHEGSGTSKAIFERAGRKKLQKACKQYHSLHEGDVVPSPGFELPARYILHAIVPKWKNGKYGEYDRLSQAYLNVLSMADIMGCESLACPLLGAGNNGFTFDVAFEIAVNSIRAFEPNEKLDRVYLVVYDAKSVMNVTQLGYEIQKEIDDKYVFSQNEQYRMPVNEMVGMGVKEAKRLYKESAVIKEVVDQGVNVAKNWIKNPDNQKKILEAAKMVVQTLKR